MARGMFVHPEIEAGEVFLGNYGDSTYEEISWETKRQGNTAYSLDGRRLDGDFQKFLFPVFVQKNEIESANSDREVPAT